MRLTVECLRCGELRSAEREWLNNVEPGECPRCGYLGWASPNDLSESVRRALRSRPPEQRRLYVV